MALRCSWVVLVDDSWSACWLCGCVKSVKRREARAVWCGRASCRPAGGRPRCGMPALTAASGPRAALLEVLRGSLGVRGGCR